MNELEKCEFFYRLVSTAYDREMLYQIISWGEKQDIFTFIWFVREKFNVAINIFEYNLRNKSHIKYGVTHKKIFK